MLLSCPCGVSGCGESAAGGRGARAGDADLGRWWSQLPLYQAGGRELLMLTAVGGFSCLYIRAHLCCTRGKLVRLALRLAALVALVALVALRLAFSSLKPEAFSSSK